MSRRSPRYIPPFAVVELTARTVGARFLLTPTLDLTLRILGCIGRALSLQPVELHAFAFLSNHWHAMVSVPDALAVARFVQCIHSTVAIAVKQLHRWDGPVFRKATQIVVAPDAEETRLQYVLSQGAKEGLVASPLDWPGAHSARALCGLEELSGEWRDRSREHRLLVGGGLGGGRKAPDAEVVTTYPIRLTPIPSWQRYTVDERHARALEIVRTIERSAARTHVRPLGAERVIAAEPTLQSRTAKRNGAPSIHTKDGNVRDLFVAAKARFTSQHREAARALRESRRAELPARCFPPTPVFQEAAGLLLQGTLKRE